MKGKFALVKINIDDAEKLADRQGIEVVPTLRLHKKGCPISQYEGDKPTIKALKEWMEWYLDLKPEKAKKKK